MARKLDVEKRERIIQEARKAFGTDGFEKTTIKAIAAATGIAQGTLYTYFKSKEELFNAVVENLWQSFSQGMNEITLSSASFSEKFMEFLDFGFELLIEVHPLLRGMYGEANRRNLLIEKVEFICRYIDDLFQSAGTLPALFGDISSESRHFNLNIMVSGILFRTSLTRPEHLEREISSLKHGVLRGLSERMTEGSAT